jgi:hypothetical protein
LKRVIELSQLEFAMTNKKYMLGLLLSLMFIGAIIISCDGNGVTSSKDIVFPDSVVSFQNHVEPFLRLKCSYSGCHSDIDQAGGRRMTDYMSLFESANVGLIIPNKPDQSLFILKIENKLIHDPLFPSNYISENHRLGLRKWISEGAQNN